MGGLDVEAGKAQAFAWRVLGSWPEPLPGEAERVRVALGRLLGDAAGPAAFLRLPSDQATGEAVRQAVAAVPARFGRVLVLGIGGSSLGARAAIEALHPLPRSGPAREVRFLANLDPASVSDALEWFHPDDTLLVAITKSGTTVETLTQFALFAERIRASGGEAGLREGVIAVTDPKRGALRRMASEFGFQALDVPPEVGGRFSVLTAVGLFPVALAGLDIGKMLRGAAQVVEGLEACAQGDGPFVHPSVASACLHLRVWERTAVRVLWAYADRLSALGDWFCQLWAESLGKARKDSGAVGQAPLRAVGSTDQHSLLQLAMEGPANQCLTFLSAGGPWPSLRVPEWSATDPDLREFAGRDVLEVFDALRAGTMAALARAGRPLLHLHVPHLDEAAIGALFAHFEVETALVGYLLGIDPFDQPGVEAGKRFAHGLLGREGFAEYGTEAREWLGFEGGKT